MSELKVNTISEQTSANGVAIDGATIKDGSLGTTANPVPINSSSLNGGQFGGRRNILYNGAMTIAQRGTSFTSIGGTAGVYSLDRMRYGFTMNSGRFTITQSTDSPNGFANSLKVDITTAESSLNASSGAAFSQFLEGQDVQQFKKGTSDAEEYSLSFHVKSNVTGTYIVELFDNDNTRQVSKSYTIDSANTWERKTITFPADTTGAFDNDNASSLFVQWFLASGTDRTSGTLNTSWASSTNANRAVGQANLFSSTDNEWYITGMQLEVGSVATPFESRSFGEELALCQRYFNIFGTDTSNAYENFGIAVAFGSGAGNIRMGPMSMPVEMRAIPTVAHSGSFACVGQLVTGTISAIGLADGGSPQHIMLNITGSQTQTSGNVAPFRSNNDVDAFISFDAEL